MTVVFVQRAIPVTMPTVTRIVMGIVLVRQLMMTVINVQVVTVVMRPTVTSIVLVNVLV